MKPHRTTQLAIAALAALGLCAPLHAQNSIAIVNSGFEDPPLAAGDLTSNAPGWSAFNSGSIGIYHPTGADYAPDGDVPEGSNIGYVFNASDESGFTQTLGTAFQEGAGYTLTVQVGNTDFFPTFPGYRVQLLAGGTVLAEDDNSLTVPSGEFVTVTATYTYDAADSALIGQPLEIRLLSKTATEATEVHFDDVQLTATLANALAIPGGPYIINVGDPLILDGSASLPTDGETITAYEWDLDNDDVFGDTSGATPAAIPYAELTTTWGMTVGENTIQLRVTDSAATTSTAQTTVTIIPETVYAGPNSTGSTNTWNSATNWDPEGVPSGGISARVPTGKYVVAWDNLTPTYTGNLTMESNTTLQIGWTTIREGSWNAVGTPGSTILTMGEGAFIKARTSGNVTMPAIVLEGDAVVSQGESTQQPANLTYAHPITGPHKFTIQSNASTGNATLTAANTMAELEIRSIVGRGGNHGTVSGTVAGAFGSGDVTITATNGTRVQLLSFDAEDVISSTATLSITGGGPSGTGASLQMNADNTVALLVVAGLERPSGTYGRVNTPAEVDFEVSWMAGDSVLTVTDNPTGDLLPPAITEPFSVFTTDAYVGSSITYTLTFDRFITTSVTTADFGNAGTADVTIDSVTQTEDNILEVVVTPDSTGTLNLEALASASFEDLFGNTLDGPFADDTTFDVLAGPQPTLVITGTAGGNNSWNTAENWDLGYPPFSTFAARIADGITARANNDTLPYSGGLTIGEGSELDIHSNAGAVNAIGTGPITFQSGATLRFRFNNTITIPGDIHFAGDAQMFNSDNSTDNRTRILNGTISGPGLFTYSMRRGNVLQLNGNNTWSGGFIANFVDTNFGNASRVQPANGGFGTGDVTLNDGISLEILSNRGDTIDDGAALFLNGRGRGNQKLILNSDETIGQLWVDNTVGDGSGSVQLPAGTYTATSSPSGPAILDITGAPLIHGNGVLTVLNGPGDPGDGPFATWANSFTGLTDSDPTLDFDGGGLATALEWVFGGDPTNPSDDAGLVPTIDATSDPDGKLLFTFRRTVEANADADTTIVVEYGNDLVGWTAATHQGTGADDITITVIADGFGTGIDAVTVALPADLAQSGRLFARLSVEVDEDSN